MSFVFAQALPQGRLFGISRLVLLPDQMSFRKNYLSGRVSVELCELRENGELSDLTVDYWIDCDCCTG